MKIPMVETSCLECVVRVSILSVTMKCGQIGSLLRNVDRVWGNSYTKQKKKSAVRCPMFDPGPSRQQNLVKSYMGIGSKYWPTDPVWNSACFPTDSLGTNCPSLTGAAL